MPTLITRIVNYVNRIIVCVVAVGVFSGCLSGEGAVWAGPTPERFAPGVISLDDRHEFGSVINAEGSRMFIGVEHGAWTSILMYEKIDGSWAAPVHVIGSTDLPANDPFLSPDESRLFFISPRNGQYDIGSIRLLGEGRWDDLVWEDAPINSEHDEYYISFLRDGRMVFASNRGAARKGDFDIFVQQNEKDRSTVFRFPETINTRAYEADAFIDPDGDYLIFSSTRKQGKGRGDLYVSHKIDGQWRSAKPIGSGVNTDNHELCPFVTADGQWLYYTSDGDIYRVSTSVLEDARKQSADVNAP